MASVKRSLVSSHFTLGCAVLCVFLGPIQFQIRTILVVRDSPSEWKSMVSVQVFFSKNAKIMERSKWDHDTRTRPKRWRWSCSSSELLLFFKVCKRVYDCVKADGGIWTMLMQCPSAHVPVPPAAATLLCQARTRGIGCSASPPSGALVPSSTASAGRHAASLSLCPALRNSVQHHAVSQWEQDGMIFCECWITP